MTAVLEVIPPAEIDGAALGIPLRDRAGAIRAFAMVDPEDYERFGHLRWSLFPVGYAARRDSRYLHREILGLTKGDGLQADHINGDRLDNRRSNLRVLTHAGNQQNYTVRRGASRFRGVTWHPQCRKWTAAAQMSGRRHYLGLFESELDAALAADDFRREHMPFAQPDQALVAALGEDARASVLAAPDALTADGTGDRGEE